MTYYKILRNGHSCNGGNLEWSLPKDGQPGEWHEVAGDIEPCRRGIHLATQPYQNWFSSLECQVFEAEAGQAIIPHGDDKIVTNRARLLRELPAPEWLTSARAFVASVAGTSFFTAQEAPDPSWKVFPTRAAAWAAAWAAAGEVVFDLLDQANLQALRSRWRIWEAGYGYSGCAVNGELYVYRRTA